jgi:GcrA cell cycle regulator
MCILPRRRFVGESAAKKLAVDAIQPSRGGKSMSPRCTATWTDARIDLLKRLWDEGVSLWLIAAALGGGISRNAVIGKIHRLALPRRGRKPAEARTRVRPGRVVRRPPVAWRRSLRGALPCAPVTLDQFNAAIPLEQRRALSQLTRSTCRWPVGEPGEQTVFFCGGLVEEGRPYCTGHCGFAYRPEEDASRISSHPIARPVARSARGARRFWYG